MFPHVAPAIAIPFVFVLGACIGSFLNVVVWRLPRGESLNHPPSHCPKCGRTLKWYDNIPIVGWIKLGGRCRFCREPISPRYPIVESVTAVLFVFYYVMFYVVGLGPCPPVPQSVFAGAAPVHVAPEWPVFFLYLFLVGALLAASLIDADLFLIPAQIPWLATAVGILFHALLDHPNKAGALNLVNADRTPSPAAALAAGGAVGLLVSLGLWWRGLMPVSFPDGDPLMEADDRVAMEREIREARRRGKDPPPLPPVYTRAQVRAEIRKEMLFLLPPMALAVLWFVATARVPALRSAWASAVRHDWVSGLLGALFGGLIGAGVVWVTRILGTLAFGRLAMGIGDVDLMFGVGAVLGAGAATIAFFLAPFFGIILAIYLLLTGTKRELPFGPYLSLGSGAVMLFYCPIADWLAPGLAGLGFWVNSLLGGGG